jgi:hypothetical protein
MLCSKEITNEFNSSSNPLKITENIKDMACGDKIYRSCIKIVDKDENQVYTKERGDYKWYKKKSVAFIVRAKRW